jgi:serine/threonine protein phosphatase PrpC
MAPSYPVTAGLTQAHTLEERAAILRRARQQGETTRDFAVELLGGVSNAVADEFRAGRWVLRLLPEDIVYDPELHAYAIAADVDRCAADVEPAPVTLLDNGIYAPELTGHIARALSPRASVYHLGALLYYALTGLEPIAEFFRLEDKLPPVRIFEPDLPLGVDPLIRRALARLPEERFPDPAAFDDALQRVLEIDELRSAAEVNEPLKIRYAGATHTGISKGEKNPHNQDRFLIHYNATLGLGLFLVADGVSTCSHGTGELAAARVVDAAEAVWEELIADPDQDVAPARREDHTFVARLSEISNRANRAIVAYMDSAFSGQIAPDAKIMSSTNVAVVLNGRRAVIGNVGDSRVYLIRDDLIDQVTVDMDRRTSLLRQGKGLESIVNTSGLGQLTTHVGCFAPKASGDGIEALPVAGVFSVLNLLAGDRLLICSDGVPDCMGRNAETRIHDIVRGSDRPTKIAWELIVAANQSGGDDNITAVIVDCIGKEDSTWPKD